MALLSRLDLKALFKNGKMPSEKDFEHLIESVLNKKDDQFRGRFQLGKTYKSGDVVIYMLGIWEVKKTVDEVCASSYPGKFGDDDPWEKFTFENDDNDWKVFEDGMYAQVYKLIGIGRKYDVDENDLPEAKIDITDEKKARYLIFPANVDSPTLSLFQIEEEEESTETEIGLQSIESNKTYFITGLDKKNVNFLSDVEAFVFRKGEYCEDGKEASVEANDGDVLMTIRSGNAGLVQVGISTLDPAAMLDITDANKGQFLFNPEDKEDPAFSIINLDPGTDKNYLATGVGKQNSVFITDAPRGFVFRHGSEYNEYCSQIDINQDGKGLMILLLDAMDRTRVGIGTEQPEALIDATDDKLSRFKINPEHKRDSAFSMLNLEDEEDKEYFAFGLGKENKSSGDETVLPEDKDKRMTVFVTNAPGGYRFNQGNGQGDFEKDPQIDQGITQVVILADGKVGIGTKVPETRLEVTDHRKSGRFLFNVDDKAPNPSLAIINTRPDVGNMNYLTLGAGNKQSIFITNSEFGYSFRYGGNINGNNNHVEIEQKSETLFSVRPEYTDSKDRKRSREMRIFPEITDTESAELHISGIVGIEKKPEEYELDVEGKVRSLISYQNADRQKMADIKQIENALEKINNTNVKPVSFTWDKSHVKNAPDGEQFGFEGQSLREVFPEVVRQTSQEEKELDTFAVAYQNMVPVLIKAIQELTEQVNSLKTEIETLKNSAEKTE